MPRAFEELDFRSTPLGALSLRRRRDPSTGRDVFEVKLGDAFLMSSRFTTSEIALAELGLAARAGSGLAVVVGGLGLGHTARAALDETRVADLVVVEALAPVIEWHESGLVPLGAGLMNDPRCRFVHGDFFRLAAGDVGFDAIHPGRRFDAILVDIDHSPDFLLDAANADFYAPAGLERLIAHLLPGGVFALWSNDPPDDAFTTRLAVAFVEAWAAPVTFDNPLQAGRSITQTVYLARAPGG
jgi:spermidine synthase